MQINFDCDGFGKDASDPADMIKLRSDMLNHLIEFNCRKLKTFGLPPIEAWSQSLIMDDRATQRFGDEVTTVVYDVALLHHRGYGSVEALAALRVAWLRNEGHSATVQYLAKYSGGTERTREVFITCEVWVNGARDEWLETKRENMRKRLEG